MAVKQVGVVQRSPVAGLKYKIVLLNSALHAAYMRASGITSAAR